MMSSREEELERALHERDAEIQLLRGILLVVKEDLCVKNEV